MATNYVGSLINTDYGGLLKPFIPQRIHKGSWEEWKRKRAAKAIDIKHRIADYTFSARQAYGYPHGAHCIPTIRHGKIHATEL